MQAALKKVILLRVASPEILERAAQTRPAAGWAKRCNPTTVVVKTGGEEAGAQPWQSWVTWRMDSQPDTKRYNDFGILRQQIW